MFTQRGRFWLLIVLFLFLLPSLVLSGVHFVDPTLANNTLTSNQTVYINVSFTELNLQSIIYNWNSTNFTLFNSSTVLLLNFNNLSNLGENGSIVKDASLSGNNGTTINGSTIITNGKYGSAITFDGLSGYARIPHSTSLQFGTGGFSINFWMKVSSTPVVSQTGQIFGKRVAGGGNYELQISNEVLVAYLETPTTQITSTYNISQHLGEWIFVTLNRNNTAAGIYVNGLLNTSATSTQNINSVAPLELGRDGDGKNEYFNGSIDNFMIFNRGLTHAEILELYFSNLERHSNESWTFFINQSQNTTGVLANGTYTYQFFATNSSGTTSNTTQWQVRIGQLLDVPEWSTLGMVVILIITISSFFLRKET
ncbi:LamG domain-containing protein [Candidatus Woesearchaeota archaeon]|nr:LamG domain-containing protein [Candidatus Woesearchaeota archaeon]